MVGAVWIAQPATKVRCVVAQLAPSGAGKPVNVSLVLKIISVETFLPSVTNARSLQYLNRNHQSVHLVLKDLPGTITSVRNVQKTTWETEPSAVSAQRIPCRPKTKQSVKNPLLA